MQTLTHLPPTSTRATTATAVAFVVAAFGLGSTGVGVAVTVALLVAAVGAWVDLRSSRIPDELVALALLPTAGAIVAALMTGDGVESVLAALLGAGILAIPLLGIHLVSPASMGFGDVKLALALGAAIGLVDPWLGLVALCVASGATALVGLALRRAALPFGPGLVVGTATALALGTALTERRLAWR